MVKYRGIVLLVCALVFAFISAFLVKNYLGKSQVKITDLVVAAADIAPNETLSIEKLKIVPWNKKHIPAGAFRNKQMLIGRIASDYILVDESIKESSLLAENAVLQGGLSGRVDSGMRAISLKVDDISGLSGLLRAGDIVDVISTSSLKGSKNAKVSRVLLQNIRVFSSEKKNKKGELSKKRARKYTITLLLTASESKILTAAQGSKIKLAARNYLDNKIEKTHSTTFSIDLGVMNAASLKEMEVAKDKSLNAKIDVGKRAFTLYIDELSGICGFLRPGNLVDIIATSREGDIAVESEIPGSKATYKKTTKISKTILQNISVITVDQDKNQAQDPSDLPGIGGRINSLLKSANVANVLSFSGREGGGGKGLAKSGQGNNATRVALLLTPAEAEQLTVAYLHADLKLIRRNSSDQEIYDLPGEKLVSCFFPEYKARFFDIRIHKGGQRDSVTVFRIEKLKKMRFGNYGNFDQDREKL